MSGTLQNIRKPPLIVAAVLMVVVVALELGSMAFIGSGQGEQSEMDKICEEEGLEPFAPSEDAQDGPPGVGIPFLAFIDVLLLLNVVIAVLALWVHAPTLAVIQGISSLIIGLVGIVGGIVALFVVIALLIVKISLFLAVPFGTLAYLALFGWFDKGGAASILGILFLLKIGFGICLLLAQQRFIQSKGLVLLFLTSLVAGIIVGFLHGLVPVFLVSITDDIGAIIAAVLGIIWMIVHLIGAIVSLVKSIV